MEDIQQNIELPVVEDILQNIEPLVIVDRHYRT